MYYNFYVSIILQIDAFDLQYQYVKSQFELPVHMDTPDFTPLRGKKNGAENQNVIPSYAEMKGKSKKVAFACSVAQTGRRRGP